MKNSKGFEVEVSDEAINLAFHRKMASLTQAWNTVDNPTVVKHNLISQFPPAPGLHAPTPTASLPAATPGERFHAVRTIKHHPFSNFELAGPGGLTGTARINTFTKGSKDRTTHDYFLEGESDEGGSYIAVGKSFQKLMDETGKNRKELAQAHLELLHGRVPSGYTHDQLARMNEHVNIFSIAEPRRDVGMFLHSYVALHNMAHHDSADFDPAAAFGYEKPPPPPPPPTDSSSGPKKSGKKEKKEKKASGDDTPKKTKKVLVPGTFAPAFVGSKNPLDEYEETTEANTTITSNRAAMRTLRTGFHTHLRAYFEGMDFSTGGREALAGADFTDANGAAEAAAEQVARSLFAGSTVLTPPTAPMTVRPSSPSRQETGHMLSAMDIDQLGRTLPSIQPGNLFGALTPKPGSTPLPRPSSPQRRFAVSTFQGLDDSQVQKTVDDLDDEAFERFRQAYKQRKSRKRKAEAEATEAISPPLKKLELVPGTLPPTNTGPQPLTPPQTDLV